MWGGGRGNGLGGDGGGGGERQSQHCLRQPIAIATSPCASPGRRRPAARRQSRGPRPPGPCCPADGAASWPSAVDMVATWLPLASADGRRQAGGVRGEQRCGNALRLLQCLDAAGSNASSSRAARLRLFSSCRRRRRRAGGRGEDTRASALAPGTIPLPPGNQRGLHMLTSMQSRERDYGASTLGCGPRSVRGAVQGAAGRRRVLGEGLAQL